MNKIQRRLANEIKIARTAVRLRKSIEADEELDPIVDEIRLAYKQNIQNKVLPENVDTVDIVKRLHSAVYGSDKNG